MIVVCTRAVAKEGVLLALSCQALASLLLADLELVLWSRRLVASRQLYVRSLPTCYNTSHFYIIITITIFYYCSVVAVYCFWALGLLILLPVFRTVWMMLKISTMMVVPSVSFNSNPMYLPLPLLIAILYYTLLILLSLK